MATCEADLIERVAHGDQEAFRQLWEAHHPAAMAAALRLYSCSGGLSSSWPSRRR